jgi:hypothetical protein
MMEETEMELLDPKRTDLENDRIVLEFIKNNLQNIYDLYPTKIENDIEQLKVETNRERRTWIQYKINQKKILLQIIDKYNDDLNKIMKDDSL